MIIKYAYDAYVSFISVPFFCTAFFSQMTGHTYTFDSPYASSH